MGQPKRRGGASGASTWVSRSATPPTTVRSPSGPYDLTGPESFTLAEAAERMSRLAGKVIRFQDESDEEAFASRQRFGAPDFEVRGWVSSYQAIRDGSQQAVSPHVRELTGRDPGSLDEYLKAHPQALDHVTGERA